MLFGSIVPSNLPAQHQRLENNKWHIANPRTTAINWIGKSPISGAKLLQANEETIQAFGLSGLIITACLKLNWCDCWRVFELTYFLFHVITAR